MKTDKEKKTTSEKPVSLAPLDLQGALEALLKVKPQPKENPKNKGKRKNKHAEK